MRGRYVACWRGWQLPALKTSSAELSRGVQVSGDLGGEMAQHADKFVTGFIRTFENNYSRFEQAVKQAVRAPADSDKALCT